MHPRKLVVVADDLGIGPETSQGILELCVSGTVTAAVLLVNTPDARHAASAWRRNAPPADLGWHPNLTLDAPVLPPARIPSLVDSTGKFHPLGRFLRRLLLGRIRTQEIREELHAQYQHFLKIAGHPPALVNAHQHIALFGPVGQILQNLLAHQRPRPYVRRISEPFQTLLRIPGSRVKRLGLTLLGRVPGNFPSADWLIGITDPPAVRHPEYFTRWLKAVPGKVVEFMCHPGHFDSTLAGRDCQQGDGYQQRRVDECQLLQAPSFRQACLKAGFLLTRPSELTGMKSKRIHHAA